MDAKTIDRLRQETLARGLGDYDRDTILALLDAIEGYNRMVVASDAAFKAGFKAAIDLVMDVLDMEGMPYSFRQRIVDLRPNSENKTTHLQKIDHFMALAKAAKRYRQVAHYHGAELEARIELDKCLNAIENG